MLVGFKDHDATFRLAVCCDRSHVAATCTVTRVDMSHRITSVTFEICIDDPDGCGGVSAHTVNGLNIAEYGNVFRVRDSRGSTGCHVRGVAHVVIVTLWL